MNYHQYIGVWKNTYSESKGVASFEFFEKNNALWIKLEGVEDGLISGSWEAFPCKIYASSIDSNEPAAFQANYQCEDFDAYCQINLNKSLIILALFVDFKDDKNKPGVFIREFYSLQKSK